MPGTLTIKNATAGGGAPGGFLPLPLLPTGGAPPPVLFPRRSALGAAKSTRYDFPHTDVRRPQGTLTPRSHMRGPTPSLRVLIVDDNEDTAASLAFLVNAWGHETRVSHDGPGALAAAQDFAPDAILLDI